MKVGSLFSGIGGFELGLEWAGMQVVWQSEIEPYCCKVLKKHWPDVPNLGDIYEIKRPPAVDLICGGFPCQPFSVAGKRKGKEDDRYLWPEMLRIIREVKPTWIIGENVAGIIHMALHQVLLDLEGEGYEVCPLVVPACAVNAPHRRNRVWIVANSQDSNRRAVSNTDKQGRRAPEVRGSDRHAPDTEHLRELQSQGFIGNEWRRTGYPDWQIPWPEVATRLCRVDDGLPAWVHRHRVKRLKALGNAIVPQITEEIGKMIMAVERAEN